MRSRILDFLDIISYDDDDVDVDYLSLSGNNFTTDAALYNQPHYITSHSSISTDFNLTESCCYYEPYNVTTRSFDDQKALQKLTQQDNRKENVDDY